MRLLVLVLATLLAPGASAHAAPLAEVVRTALASYPSIQAARSERIVAGFDLERARALHYPTVELVGTGRIAGDARSRAQPLVRVNIWSAGGIEATVERESQQERALAGREVEKRGDVAFEATQSYLRLLRAVRTLEATRRNLARHEALAADFEAIASIDVGRRYDLVQARARLEQVRLQMSEREAEIAAAGTALGRFYRAPLAPESLSMPSPIPEPTSGAIAAAPADHPAVQAAPRELLAAEADVKVARARQWPRLDIESTVGKDGATALVVAWPLFDLGRGAAEQAAHASLWRARARLEEQVLVVEERRQAALQDFRAVSRREQVSRGQIALAEELVEVYRAQFQIGRRNLIDLLNAFNELSNAEVTFEASRVDRTLARYRIEYALGRLAPLFEGSPQ